ncbi:16S rRNA (cytidine1402-2'-O)-methyltransferase [Devosia enhydra]|uniref:Ribosomal RNA small subunit methyltransferase I n=1 Tax=Devosia enhydra TaxID=665118 RepID=A0A1K2HYK8_9HYPH|nr:16S rRNA (cytidine(1402)-2'-O)-methyltransferase [Devosia enhydra]SFZ84998.1 16S rRNA (cytidine1402-2'-O)-methyltransferase [Devosia enhydra]
MTEGTPEPSYHVAGQKLAATRPQQGLYVVATPIGNLADITIRALGVLAGADLVLCEDTRHSATLLDHYGIRTPRRALHEHNEHARIGEVIDRLGQGAAIALISDAGTPLLSDPGFPLVRAVREAGLPVFAVPGASALLSALSVAGLPTDAFGFFGFLPARQAARRKALAQEAERRDTLVYYESPRRLAETLADMAESFGADREAAVALELTKRFERVERGTLADLAARFAEGETRGEAVVLVAGAPERVVAEADWQEALAEALEAQSVRDAVDAVAARFGLKRKEVYDAALALREQKP